jgi:hypothetical protein
MRSSSSAIARTVRQGVADRGIAGNFLHACELAQAWLTEQ